jgi:hypothetical protein
VLKLLTFPAANDRSPRFMEKALAAIHQGLRQGELVSLEIGVAQGRIGYFLRGPGQAESVVQSPLLASYPQARIADVDSEQDPVTAIPAGWQRRSLSLTLHPQLFPILRHAQFEDMLLRSLSDPIDAVLRSVTPTGESRGHLRLDIRAASQRYHYRARRTIELLERSFFREHQRLAEWYADHALERRWLWLTLPMALLARCSAVASHGPALDVSSGARHEREADLQAAADKVGGHLFHVELTLSAEAVSDAAAEAKLRLMASALGAFTRSRLATFHVTSRRRSFVLSQEELATLWHPPLANAGVEQLNVALFRELEPPPNLPSGEEPGGVGLGRVRFRDDRRLVGLSAISRSRHVHVIGRSGTGKTTLLLNMIHSDLNSQQNFALIDPHGDLADAVLSLVPPERTNDVIVLDAGDREFAVGFNPLACPDPARVDQVAGGVVAAFQKMNDSWGPRLGDLLRGTVFAVIEQGGTLLTLLQLLGDAAYRERVVPRIGDPIVRHYFQHEVAGWSKAYRTEAIAAVQNKIRPFLTSPTMRAIVSQTGKTLDLRTVMDGKVLVVNLSKGKIGEDNSALLGALIVTSIQQAAMTRVDFPEAERKPFALYVDEFQNFATSTFATLLSESRKFGIGCILSHQFRSQLSDDIAAAVTGNVGSTVTFAVGGDDAEDLALHLSREPGQLTPQDLTNLPKHTAIARLLMDGTQSSPFTIVTLPPTLGTEDRATIVRRCSRRQHARPIAHVLDDVERELTA